MYVAPNVLVCITVNTHKSIGRYKVHHRRLLFDATKIYFLLKCVATATLTNQNQMILDDPSADDS